MSRQRSTRERPQRSEARPSIAWPRLAVAGVVALVAFLWTGVLPLSGAWPLHAVAAGLIVGLAVRVMRELLPAALIAAAAALAGAGIGVAALAADAATPAAWEIIVAAVEATAITGVVGWVCTRGWRAAAALVAVVFACGLFLYEAGALPGEPRTVTARQQASLTVEPPAEQYAFDGYLYLKVNWLMQGGTPYYDAFLQAYEQDKRLSGPPPGLFGIRQPWLFAAWKYLPGAPGIKVWHWFLALVVVTMLAAYGLARRFVEPAAALLAPLALGGYMLTPAVSAWFPLSEFWAGCLAIWFLYAMVWQRWTAAALLLVLAFSFRELMAFLVAIYVIWWVFSKQRREGLLGLVIVLAGPVVLYGLHTLWAPAQGGSAGHWLQGGIDRLAAALRFSGSLALASRWTYLLAPLLALAGAILTRAVWLRVLLAAAVAIPVVALTAFSGGQWNDYWGAIAVPMILALVPLAAGPWLPSRLSVLDAPAGRRTDGAPVLFTLYARGAAAGRGEHTRAAVDAIIAAIGERRHEILLIDESGARELDDAALRDQGVRVRRAGKSASKGGGAKMGAATGSARQEASVLIDAACAPSAGTVAGMLAAWDAGADVVVASRLAPGARSGGQGAAWRRARGLSRRAWSAVYRSLYPLPGLRDYRSPAVLLSKDAAGTPIAPVSDRGVAAGSTDWLNPDVLMAARGTLRVAEVPLVAEDCLAPSGGSASYAGGLLRARLRMLP